MNQEKLHEVLKMHEAWLNREEGGERADLRDADLSGADLSGADLRGANPSYADLDYSCLPLWCGGTEMIIDDRLAKQFAYHAMCNMSKEQLSEFLKDPVAFANGFHRIGDVEEINANL